jgi:serine/threonine protein kinase
MGVVLFELLTGTLEFIGKKRPALLHADIPPWLDEMVLRCMAKDLKKRYRTTDEVSAALMKLKGAGPG